LSLLAVFPGFLRFRGMVFLFGQVEYSLVPDR
jgi:hypothetical protein